MCRNYSVPVFALGVLLALVIAIPKTPSALTLYYYGDDLYAKTLFDLANKERTTKLNWNGCLAQYARQRARALYGGGYFSHTDPRTGFMPFPRLVDSCLYYQHAAENLVRNYFTPEEAHAALMCSPSHKEAILSPNYSDMGVGCYMTICVELFASTGENSGLQ